MQNWLKYKTDWTLYQALEIYFSCHFEIVFRIRICANLCYYCFLRPLIAFKLMLAIFLCEGVCHCQSQVNFNSLSIVVCYHGVMLCRDCAYSLLIILGWSFKFHLVNLAPFSFGLPLGSILGPLFYILFISDLSHFLSSVGFGARAFIYNKAAEALYLA